MAVERCEILVAGAGPAGIAAACAAAESGRDVLLLDENQAPGGQIWRRDIAHLPKGDTARWLERLRKSGARILPGTAAVAFIEPRLLLAGREIAFDRLILATGARELFLPFPGWTLPNVSGAGGLQALVKGGLPAAGKRVVIAGTGPLLLAVAAYLRRAGARIVVIAEQAPLARLAHFAFATLGAKSVEALRLAATLGGIPYRTSSWPVSAEGAGKVERVTLNTGTYECDYLACGFGLVPNLELAMMAACAIAGGFVAVDGRMQTSVEGIYCAGEPTGIGGLERSLLQGEIAGYAAADANERAPALASRLAAQERFRTALARDFALRAELKHLATKETIVCRCEDVRAGDLEAHDSWRAAKLHTRCGMGPCQGRICGTALEVMRGWPRTSVRPPALPTMLRDLSGPRR